LSPARSIWAICWSVGDMGRLYNDGWRGAIELPLWMIFEVLATIGFVGDNGWRSMGNVENGKMMSGVVYSFCNVEDEEDSEFIKAMVLVRTKEGFGVVRKEVPLTMNMLGKSLVELELELEPSG